LDTFVSKGMFAFSRQTSLEKSTLTTLSP